VLARHARAGGAATLNALLVLLSNLTMMVRLTVIAALVQPTLLPAVASVTGAALLAFAPVALWLAPGARRDSDLPAPALRNPTDLRTALGFGLAYGTVSLLAAWASARLGEGALYAVAAVSGLTDVDAISLSGLRLYGTEAIDAATAVTVIAIAVVANLVFKGGIAFVAGNAALGARCAVGFGAMAAAMAVAIGFLR
jgi:uncharacterized membrane protein (DUF4010 family)